MKLSIVIVNYNVEFFLEQCLHSVRKACQGIASEVWVVDNNSVDGSLQMLAEKFPEVKVIANKENAGFARANNQAVRLSAGEYVLLLNPDTIVEEDTFRRSIEFMDSHPDAGALGVKMVDGNGRYLRESKRGLPTPGVALFKILGLASLFPRSPLFARYYMGHLPDDETNAVDILAGAFMLLRTETLRKTGLLDEDYFMYGEDVDLSYRIVQAGYKNYYFPHTRIIHYKGESTRKSTVNYVFTFYQAMAIFAGKHFSGGLARRFVFLINMAIFLRASLSVMSRIARKLFLPIADAAIVFGGVWVMKIYWEEFIFHGEGHYPATFVFIILPVYILIWILGVYLSGGYDRPYRLLKSYQGIFLSTVFILAAYGLLSEEYRYSRALILFGALWGVISLSLTRFLLHLTGSRQYRIGFEENRRFLIVGGQDECERVAGILRSGLHRPSFIGFVAPAESHKPENGFIGSLDQVRDIVVIYKVDEIVFCGGDLSAQFIIDKMLELQDLSVDYKIAPPESYSIIGSNSISTSVDPFIIDVNSVTSPRNRRNKRLADIAISVALLLAFPLAVLKVQKKRGLLINSLSVMAGRKTWVGLVALNGASGRMPATRPGVVTPDMAWPSDKMSEQTAMNLSLLYARDYKFINDFLIVIRALPFLGR
jgi:GT2 family glycosyltransferase